MLTHKPKYYITKLQEEEVQKLCVRALHLDVEDDILWTSGFKLLFCENKFCRNGTLPFTTSQQLGLNSAKIETYYLHGTPVALMFHVRISTP